MDNETVLFLLKDGHIDMTERFKKRIWPHPPLFFSHIVNILAGYLKLNRCFPSPWIERKDGELIDDSSVIEKTDDKNFTYRSRRAHPINLTKIGINIKKTFKTAESAAEYYLRNDLNLPGDLDGWVILDK
jgi:hypothetical protein